MDTQQVKELLQRYQAGNCTGSESELVENWYKQLLETGEWTWNEGEKDRMQEMIKARLMQQINAPQKKKVFYLNSRFPWWAAASVILLLGTFSYFFFFRNEKIQAPVATILNKDVEPPQSNKATITLANGQRVYLDSAGNGMLTVQAGVNVMKLADGQIVYRESSIGSGELVYNTLTNPRGSKVIDITLADGSHVWLNAGSSVTYPVAFTGNERKVSVTGEAYFEVTHDATKPFWVYFSSPGGGSLPAGRQGREGAVQVLGTHFNVNAYDDEDELKVTLLEGSVKIGNLPAGNRQSAMLKPGQQAKLTTADSRLTIHDNVDLEQVMAWKNGYFQFDNASLQHVLKEVSRWYDVDVIYEGRNQPRQFVGEIQRDLNLAEVLKILEKNKVGFTIEGKELRIMPD